MKAIGVIMGFTLFITGFLQVNVAAERPDYSVTYVADKDSIKDADYRRVSSMLDSMNFVLEADYLSDKYGNRIPVTSSLNFISVDSTNAVLQTGNNSGIGYNGVGGVTAEGHVSSWKVKKNEKRKTFHVSMNVNTNIGMYTVFMDISSSGRATATLSGLWPGKLTWDGYIVPLEETRTFQGSSSY